MSRYDDAAVIALLRESVPGAPDDVPDRVAMVRHKAGSQRAALWTQALGAVASVLLVVGVAAAVSSTGGADPVEPTSEPIRALSEAFTKEDSVRFEATVTPVGDYSGAAAKFRESLTSHVTGAATKDGDVEIEGDLSFALMLGDPGGGNTRIRVVDGEFYRTTTKADFAPAGVDWVQDEGESQTGVADLVRVLKLADALVEDVRYTGGATVRGVPVAEYRLTVPKRYTGSEITVTFALDAEDRLRRVAAELSYREFLSQGTDELPTGGNPLMVNVELLLHGYGDDVDIDKPPADKTMTSEQLYEATKDEREAAWREFQSCAQRAGKDRVAAAACAEKMGFPPGYSDIAVGGLVDESCYQEMGPDGTFSTTCSGSASATTSGGWTSTGAPPATPVPLTASPAP